MIHATTKIQFIPSQPHADLADGLRQRTAQAYPHRHARHESGRVCHASSRCHSAYYGYYYAHINPITHRHPTAHHDHDLNPRQHADGWHKSLNGASCDGYDDSETATFNGKNW